jgi:hypothetical protein
VQAAGHAARKAISLPDVSLVHAREVRARPVMAGVRQDTAPSRLCPCRVTQWHDPRRGEAWQDLAAPLGLAAVIYA